MSSAEVASNWETLYREGGGRAFYPWDSVVSFVTRRRGNRSARDISIIEIGSGAGANLWFCAREGYRVVGIDGSASAISAAHARLKQEGFAVPIHQALIGEPLPFPAATFDLAIDRAAMACNDPPVMSAGLAEIARVLKPGGAMMSTVYTGPCVGQCCGSPHYPPDILLSLYRRPWRVVSLLEVERTEHVAAAAGSCSEFIIEAEID